VEVVIQVNGKTTMQILVIYVKLESTAMIVMYRRALPVLLVGTHWKLVLTLLVLLVLVVPTVMPLVALITQRAILALPADFLRILVWQHHAKLAQKEDGLKSKELKRSLCVIIARPASTVVN